MRFYLPGSGVLSVDIRGVLSGQQGVHQERAEGRDRLDRLGRWAEQQPLEEPQRDATLAHDAMYRTTSNNENVITNGEFASHLRELDGVFDDPNWETHAQPQKKKKTPARPRHNRKILW